MTTQRKQSNKPAVKPAPAPAASQPADQEQPQAFTKYTRNITEATVVEGVERSNATTMAQITENGKPIFKTNTGVFKAGIQPKMGPTSYKAAMYNALDGRPFAEGVAAAIIACAKQPGAVPPRYSESYRLTAAWLEGKGPLDKTHMVNVAKHIAGYVNGWMLKPTKGGMTLR
jgi:hypothetical protein